MKRFYREVSVVGNSVALDGRPIRTPARAPLDLPSAALAHAIAAEWDAQSVEIVPATMPMTGFANAAIDRVAPDPAGFADRLAAFVESELLCYRAEGPVPLARRQTQVWDPLLAWATARYDIAFAHVTGVIHRPQPAATLARIAGAYRAFDPFKLAALHPIVTICGSAVIGLAVAERRIDAAAAFAAGQLDELWQAEQWGEDPLAAASLAGRRTAVDDAVRLLALL